MSSQQVWEICRGSYWAVSVRYVHSLGHLFRPARYFTFPFFSIYTYVSYPTKKRTIVAPFVYTQYLKNVIFYFSPVCSYWIKYALPLVVAETNGASKALIGNPQLFDNDNDSLSSAFLSGSRQVLTACLVIDVVSFIYHRLFPPSLRHPLF